MSKESLPEQIERLNGRITATMDNTESIKITQRRLTRKINSLFYILIIIMVSSISLVFMISDILEKLQ